MCPTPKAISHRLNHIPSLFPVPLHPLPFLFPYPSRSALLAALLFRHYSRPPLCDTYSMSAPHFQTSGQRWYSGRFLNQNLAALSLGPRPAQLNTSMARIFSKIYYSFTPPFWTALNFRGKCSYKIPTFLPKKYLVMHPKSTCLLIKYPFKQPFLPLFVNPF